MMKRLFIGIILCLGICLTGFAQRNNNQLREQSLKYQRLMALIDAFYVDTVNLPKLTEEAIVKVLSDLDPHSVYITKEEVEEMNEPLEGGFFGIGIQFTIYQDTLMVVSVVPGGPSEKVGLLARGQNRVCGRGKYRRSKTDQYPGKEAVEGGEGNSGAGKRGAWLGTYGFPYCPGNDTAS